MTGYAANETMTRRRSGSVLLLDALGTKGIALQADAETIIGTWQKHLDLLGEFISTYNRIWGDDASSMLSFSDTIYVTVELEDAGQAVEAMSQLGEWFYQAMIDGIYFRGAVSLGSFYQSGTKVFGPAVDEAAEWHEQADWMGVIATPSFARSLDLLELLEVKDLHHRFYKHKVPLKNVPPAQRPEIWCLAWPRLIEDPLIEAKKNILSTFSELSGVVSPAVLPKYNNTLEFLSLYESTGMGKEL